jgi:hypothetical protein
VGTGVGTGVGCGVGTGVGTGVGAGVAALCTTTVPVMNEWKKQWYANVPAALKVKVKLAFCPSEPLSHTPVFEVLVWATPISMFVQRTLSPALIVIVAGVNAKFWMVTLPVAVCGAALAVVMPKNRSASVASASRTALIVRRIR